MHYAIEKNNNNINAKGRSKSNLPRLPTSNDYCANVYQQAKNLLMASAKSGVKCPQHPLLWQATGCS